MLFANKKNLPDRILVVEDEFIIAADLSFSLQNLNYNIVGTASSGNEAINLALKLQPDIIIMDIRLKGDMSGIDAAKIIKDKIDVPIIFLTANSDNATLEKAKLIAPEGFIIKPIDIKELNAAIQIALHNSRLNSKILENESWLNATLESIDDGIVALDSNGIVKFINSAALSILDCEHNFFKDLNFFNFLKLYHDDTNSLVLDILPKILKNAFLKWDKGLYLIDSKSNKKFVSFRSSLIHDRKKNISGILIAFKDITIRKMEKQKLKDNSEKSEKLKTQFISQMSHEIRTPLNNILTFISLLRDEFESKLPVGLENAFEIIKSSSTRLIRTIELLINMSKLQSGNFDTDYQLIDIDADVLEELCYTFYSKATNKNLEFNYSNCANNAIIIGDKYSLEQIFNNLIDNAVKYTQKGSINVSIYNNEDSELIVKIKDSGIGMSPEFMSVLYKPFSQDSSIHNHELKGTGLGLALVKKYIELNNGSILVESKPGEGTEFTLSFKAVKEKYRNIN